MLFQVAWFVSNCHPRNQRMHYAKELSKYIQVDIYGTCGSLRCPRSQSQACFDMLDEDYKFYLAFENSNCKDYITEKFFVNGLGYEITFINLNVYACSWNCANAAIQWFFFLFFFFFYQLQRAVCPSFFLRVARRYTRVPVSSAT